jgi:wyosine [tRNA(Phe)-imidazoG37] synthetase (radical SAM superfamily)
VTGQTAEISNALAAVRDHSRRYQDFLYVYPVISRRSRGLSIGVNLNPDKRCNFDCVYCEVDRLTPPRTTVVDIAVVKSELEFLVRHAQAGGLAMEPKFSEAPALSRVVRDIAFSGDGEPTMVPNFDECVRAVVDVRRALGLNDSKIVLITDAAGLDKASVHRGLELMDHNNGEIWAKLDAGSPEYFRTVNRTPIFFDRILKNLRLAAQARPIVIQTLFLKVRGEPMSAAELELYCGRLNDIVAAGGRIKEVHAYTVARPTPEAWATRLEPAELYAITDAVRGRTGLEVIAFP